MSPIRQAALSPTRNSLRSGQTSPIIVSPFPGEPLDWIIANTGPEMLVYASDYPHPEGTSDPIHKFEAKMGCCAKATMDAFYHGNMEQLMGIKL